MRKSKRQKAKEEFFQKLPGFLGTIQEIDAKGFLAQLSVSMNAYGDTPESVTITGMAHIPSHQRYMCPGIPPIVSISGMLEKTKALVVSDQLTVKSVWSETKNEDWPLYNRAGSRIAGSRGTRVTFKFGVVFHF